MGDEARVPIPEGYLPLTPAVLDIMVILGNEETHGYAITQEVRRRTKGQRRLVPGTPHRSLKQMHERGLLAESEERPEPGLDGERRRYHRPMELGRRVALAEVERLEGLVRAGRSKGFVPGGHPRGGPFGPAGECCPPAACGFGGVLRGTSRALSEGIPAALRCRDEARLQ